MKKTITEESIVEVATNLLSICKERKREDKALLVFLQGDLGAGKTTATKVIAKLLGIQEDITSPTFVILKRYSIPQTEKSLGFENLVHIDAYRLKGFAELEKIKFDEYRSNSKNIIILEWPEMVEDGGLVADVVVKVEHGEGEGERVVEII